MDRYASIHIAGTNGKGSTAAFCTEILKRSGYRTGFTLSPHLEDFRERIQVNGQWISKEALIGLHEELKAKVSHIPLTYFEWATLLAFCYFASEKVDIAVLETGMGGRWDATNIASPLVGAITNISRDHTQYLGEKLAEILSEKIEILKPGMTAWSGIEEESLIDQLKQRCEERHIPLFLLRDHFHEEGTTFSMLHYSQLKIRLLGQHQHRNAALAVGMMHSLQERGFSIPEIALREGLSQVRWAGRLEVISQKPLVLIDAAHNPAGIGSLVEFLKSEGKKFHLIFGTLKDRPFEEMLIPLLPFAQSLHLAYFEEARAFSFDELKQKALALSKNQEKEIEVLDLSILDWENFHHRFPPDEAILITGSIYLISRMRLFIMGEEA